MLQYSSFQDRFRRDETFREHMEKLGRTENFCGIPCRSTQELRELRVSVMFEWMEQHPELKEEYEREINRVIEGADLRTSIPGGGQDLKVDDEALLAIAGARERSSEKPLPARS